MTDRLHTRNHRFFVLLTALLAAPAFAQQASAELDVAAFEGRLQSRDTAAADELWALADANPGFIADGFPKWQKHLLALKRFEVVEQLSLVAIVQKPAAWPAVADAQRARVEALLALGKFSEGLVEAKRYYDLAPMAKTDDAVAYVLTAINGLNAPDAVERAKRMMAEQTAPAAAPRPLADDLAPRGDLAKTVLGAIVVDATPYEAAINQPPGETTFDQLIGKANLLLLAGRPGEAKACFRKAVETQGKGGKPLIMAVEGVARCIRAEDGSPARANAFLKALRG